MSDTILCRNRLDRSVRLALTTRDRIPFSSGGTSVVDVVVDEDDEHVDDVVDEYLVGSKVTTPPDCAPLIIVTLTYDSKTQSVRVLRRRRRRLACGNHSNATSTHHLFEHVQSSPSTIHRQPRWIQK